MTSSWARRLSPDAQWTWLRATLQVIGYYSHIQVAQPGGVTENAPVSATSQPHPHFQNFLEFSRISSQWGYSAFFSSSCAAAAAAATAPPPAAAAAAAAATAAT